MTLVNIDLRNQGYETGPDDRVIFYSLLVREGDFGTISTAPVEVELVDGKATVDLAPGPVGVQIVARQVADTRIKIGEVPPSGPTTLGAVMMVTPAYTPALQKMMIAAIERAKEIAVGQVDGAVSTAIDAEVGEFKTKAEQALMKSTAAESKSDTALSKSTTAESSAGNAVSRVTALEALGGLSPESPMDGQTANLIAQPSTLTRVAARDAISSETAMVSVERFGAKGDGATDDTASIQSAIDWISSRGGGTVHVPDGVYMIKAHVEGPTPNTLQDQGGVALRDGVHLQLSTNAVLQAIPNAERNYVIVRFYDVHNASLSGGEVRGERDQHGGTVGEWGHGICITGGRNIRISDTTVSDCWGDAIYTQETLAPNPLPDGYIGNVPVGVFISRVVCTGNRRQGLSIVGVDGMVVTDSVFEKTNGTAPEAGVDIEPLRLHRPTRNMRFERCVFRDNAGNGFVAVDHATRDVVVADCVFERNMHPEGQLKTSLNASRFTFERNIFRETPSGVGAMHLRGGEDYTIRNNIFDSRVVIAEGNNGPLRGLRFFDNVISSDSDTLNAGLYLLGVDSASIRGNEISVSYPTGRAIQVHECVELDIIENLIHNSYIGILTTAQSDTAGNRSVRILRNRISDISAEGIRVSDANDLDIAGNLIQGAGLAASSFSPIYARENTSGVRIRDNTFIQAPTFDSGGGERSTFAINVLNETDPDLRANGNVLVAETGRTFRMWNPALLTLAGGYIAEPSGVMSAPTSALPTAPTVGTQVWDTTISRLVVWNGSSWEGLTGA